ncbi:baeRF2 domain-containing protein [Nocardioides sp. URHA0020]|uniref:baeRF2 domain-containing protein n=1 Tax=Nocardioides sp. URHA0020 TaxID=1380392 RepID=UPI00048C1066|nr:Vms1/Ankzf1 family peptidyl-tRNA hydrolase [Nocardioides sp. URHA0020]
MDTTHLTPLFQDEGPFATVLIDVSHDSQNGEHEHDLRVRAACATLAEQGADEATIDALRTAIEQAVDRPAPTARFVVASARGVLLDELAGFRVDQTVATWAPFPDLTGWIEHRDSAVGFVLALVDHEGGDVAVYDSDVPEPREETSITGDEQFVHKVPVGGWSALRYQHVTENVWAQNAEAVVEEITSHVRAGHRLVLLAGDPQSRGMVRSQLEGTRAEVVELESGTRNEDGGDEALQQAIREALVAQVVQRQLALVHELKDRLGRNHAVATGVDEVADAFVRGQVDTLLLDPAAADELRLRPSEHPGLVLGSTTPSGPVRADQALVAAAAMTSAAVATFPSAAMKGAPVAALLRWEQ